MEITTEYIISQVFTIITYVLLAVTYYAKDRKAVLTISFLSLIANALAYGFLFAYTGVAMCFIALIRNIIFLIEDVYYLYIFVIKIIYYLKYFAVRFEILCKIYSKIFCSVKFTH